MNNYFLIRLLFSRTQNGDWHKEAWAGKAHCPYCEKKSDFSIVYNTASARFVGIPFFTVTDDRFIQCDRCNDIKKITIKEFRNIKKQQWQAMESGNYPAEKILSHYNPDKSQSLGIITKFILGAVLTLLFVIILLYSVFKGAFEWGYVFLTVLSTIPFLFSLLRFVPMVKKRKLYNKAKRYPEAFASMNEITPADRTYIFAEQWLRKREVDETAKEFNAYVNPEEPITDHMAKDDSSITRDDKKGKTSAVADTKPSLLLKIWYKISAFLFSVPFGFSRHKDLYVYCKELCGKRQVIMGTVSVISITYVISSVILAVILSTLFKIDSKDLSMMLFNTVVMLGVCIPFTIVNAVKTRRTIRSLLMLKKSENIKYMAEIMPYVRTGEQKAVLKPHLLYDKPCKVVIAYSDITWTFQREDEEGKPRNYIGTMNGNIFGTTLETNVLAALSNEFAVMTGYTRENKAAFYKMADSYNRTH